MFGHKNKFKIHLTRLKQGHFPAHHRFTQRSCSLVILPPFTSLQGFLVVPLFWEGIKKLKGNHSDPCSNLSLAAAPFIILHAFPF